MQDKIFSWIWPLNLNVKCWIRSLWTRPYGVKQRPSLPNRHVRSVFFWDITQHRVVIPYRHFRTTYRPYLQKTSNPKDSTVWLKLTETIFWGGGTLSIVNFFQWSTFWKPTVFPFSKKHLTWCTLRLSYSQSLPIIETVTC